MAASEEEWIRHRAYQLWEQEGYPSGKDQEHWERAKLEYALLKPAATEKGKSGRKASGVSPPEATAPATKTSSKTKKPAAKTAAPKAAKPASSKSSAVKPAPADKAESKAKPPLLPLPRHLTRPKSARKRPCPRRPPRNRLNAVPLLALSGLIANRGRHFFAGHMSCLD
ncbi:DUF2934 domain-containing protein [Aliirhizobium terrae]|uniref:DUF2934 domain-containing protein n=1 Tax=Terrirhizobium terrae TaxID=2926709 RepID=UPI00257814EE|nr:DUF2934 domain-containing protein [Rhizobium sp. CC-CFT758]WJH42142.1 DUF2934 domain-containing protein [Rhizobium sp. CC-CFT758]